MEENVQPKTWLVESILVTLFCCLPFGIVGIVNAAKVNSLYASGNIEAAQQASATAAKWTKIGFIVGIVVIIVYAISYKVGIVHSDVAEVTFQTTLERFGTQKAYRIEANGKTYPFFNWFFNLDDTYISRLDAESLRPLDLQIEIREGGYRVSSGYRYDWQQKKVSTFFFNHKRADSSHHVMTLQEGSFDAVALFFNLRCENIDTFKEGENRTLHMVLSDTIRTIRYRYVGPETIKVKGLGRFRALRFTCQIATSSGVTPLSSATFSQTWRT